MSVVIRGELALIGLYRAISNGRPSPCRFVPSCSQYALDALDGHGFVKANRLIARRLLRCHPWGGWGADPVPSAPSSKLSVVADVQTGAVGRPNRGIAS